MFFKKRQNKEQLEYKYKTINSSVIGIIPHYLDYRKTYNFLKKSQWWSRKRLEKYQLLKLKKLLKNSYNNVPYYKKIFDQNNFKPDKIKNLDEIKKIPFLTKEIIHDNFEDLKAKNFPKRKFEYLCTGGSTGEPLGLFVEKNKWFAINLAYGRIMIEWTGCKIKDKFLTIKDFSDIPYKFQMFRRILAISSFYINNKHMPLFIKKIKKLEPKFIMSYPSAIYLIAKFIKDNKIQGINGIKAVICYAENLYDWQKQVIEEVFKCKVFEQYGLTEQCVLGATCKEGNLFHIFPEFGYFELVDNDGNDITKEGEIGEIVGTGFIGDIFPFIRYKTGDLGVFTKEKCACGREYPSLKKILGRKQDYLVLKNNVTITGVGMHHIVSLSTQNVKNIQIYQDTPGKIEIKIVKNKNYTERDEENIIKNFDEKYGKWFEIKIIYVDEISLTKYGKYKFLIQKIKID